MHSLCIRFFWTWAALILTVTIPAAANAMNDPLQRLEQDGEVYYGTVVASSGGQTFTTCGGDQIPIKPTHSLVASVRRCLNLRSATGAGSGPIPAATPTPSPPGATPSPLGPQTRAVLLAEPLTLVHYDAMGNIVSPTDTMSAAAASLTAAFWPFAYDLANKLTSQILFESQTQPSPTAYVALCHFASDGIIILGSPKLELYDGPTARTANLTVTVRSVTCASMQDTPAGTIATGFHPDGLGPAWTAQDVSASVQRNARDLEAQLLALQE